MSRATGRERHLRRPGRGRGLLRLGLLHFTATAGQPITIGTEDPGGFPSTYTIIDLWLGCNQLLASDGDSGPRWYSLIYRFTAPVTGTYSMRVQGSYVRSSALSRLHLHRRPADGRVLRPDRRVPAREPRHLPPSKRHLLRRRHDVRKAVDVLRRSRTRPARPRSRSRLPAPASCPDTSDTPSTTTIPGLRAAPVCRPTARTWSTASTSSRGTRST